MEVSGAPCTNGPGHSDKLEQAIWQRVQAPSGGGDPRPDPSVTADPQQDRRRCRRTHPAARCGILLERDDDWQPQKRYGARETMIGRTDEPPTALTHIGA